jgi:hypothetical protein
MAEEYENYRAMLEEARQWAQHQDEAQRSAGPEPEGIVLVEDLAALEQRLREAIEHVLHRFEELHTRLWELEARVKRLEGDGPP